MIKITYILRQERLRHNMSIRELARLSGISKSQISAIERNVVHPTLFCMCILAETLQTDLSNLYKICVSNMTDT